MDLKDLAVSVIDKEARAVENLKPYVDDSFIQVLHLIYGSKGRLVITGIGKSAIIGNKIVATLNSTGTPSIFMHAADAIHVTWVLCSRMMLLCASQRAAIHRR